jgi:hypothetical protein
VHCKYTLTIKLITYQQSCKTGVKRCTVYKGYNIEPDLTGYAPKHSTYHFYIDSEKVDGYGESIEDCKKQIDEL